jgi:multidrug resistance efflux pump
MMSGVDSKANDGKTVPGIKRRSVLSSIRVVPILVTVVAVAVAAVAGWQAWQYYMGTPWTRDGTVRAYVVKIAPQVAGEIVQLPIVDNQFVHKGDLLMLIDPRNYSIAVRQAQATVEQTRASAENANAEMTRRLKLSDIAVTEEERQTYVSQAATAEATYQSALANLDQARINLDRTQIRSPVNGYVTNLTAQLGDYADVGVLQLSVVNSDSYWVDAYFEETALGRIHEGDAATIKLMGYSPLLRGRVQGLARGINVPNATPDASGLASVNPIFTFVRLAQRVPVRIHIDEVPKEVELVAGLTATVQVEPYKAPPASGSTPASEQVSEAPPKAAPSQTAAQAAAQAAPSQTPSQAPAHAAPSQAASQRAPPAAPAAQASPASSQDANQLAVSDLLSPQASAAAAAASADLKTLQEQIAAHPPSGGASPPPATNPGSAATTTGSMPPSEYLGQTIDLFADQSASPQPTPRTPDSIRRRARSTRPHYGHQ